MTAEQFIERSLDAIERSPAPVGEMRVKVFCPGGPLIVTDVKCQLGELIVLAEKPTE